MDFRVRPELAELRDRTDKFVRERVVPREREIVEADRRGDWSPLRALREEAKREGLFTPHLPPEFGGLGLGIMGMCALFRVMGRSPVGAAVFNCDAPDQGNMELLLRSAKPGVKERWLRPLCNGDATSAFCMTEPAPGAGADPSNLRTRAVRKGDKWVIDGHKWYSTGGKDASFLIVMARTSDDARTGASMFVVDKNAPGVEFVRVIPTMHQDLLWHKECEFKFHGVTVGEDAVLGEIGQGFALAQVRLVPARLTHCMRWLGLADRALEMCKDYITTRISFGKELARHQFIQDMIAENALAVHAGNLMTFHVAWMIEQGLEKEARTYSSMAKLHVARALCKLLDDAIQMHGGLGFSEDVPFSAWYRALRAARLADGPDEVHKMVIARDYLMRGLKILV